MLQILLIFAGFVYLQVGTILAIASLVADTTHAPRRMGWRDALKIVAAWPWLSWGQE